jgi:hypothetical protein
VDTDSAYEILNGKLEQAAVEEPEEKARPATSRASRPEKSTAEKILDSSVTRQIGRTAASIITRSLLGALGIGGRKRSSRSIF